jgi:hypothetical protein
LPPYPVLDGILRLYVEEGLSRAEILDKGYEQTTVDDIVRKSISTNINANKLLLASKPPR